MLVSFRVVENDAEAAACRGSQRSSRTPGAFFDTMNYGTADAEMCGELSEGFSLTAPLNDLHALFVVDCPAGAAAIERENTGSTIPFHPWARRTGDPQAISAAAVFLTATITPKWREKQARARVVGLPPWSCLGACPKADCSQMASYRAVERDGGIGIVVTKDLRNGYWRHPLFSIQRPLRNQ